MLKKNKQNLIGLFLMFGGLLAVLAGFAKPVHAAGVQIYPELPKNNIGGQTLGYFNLPNATHKKQTVRIKVHNPRNKATKVTVHFTNAVTRNGGQVDYIGLKKPNRQLLPAPATEQLSAVKQLRLAPFATKWLKIHVAPSDSAFKGRKAAAVVLTNKTKQRDVSVQNNYVYVVGLTLNGSKLKPAQFKRFKVKRVQPQVKGRQAKLRTKLVNPDPMYLKKGNLKLTFQNKKWALTKYTAHKKNVEAAPNSDFWVNTNLGGKRLVPGDYRLTVNWHNDQYHKKTVRQVHITKKTAYFINRHNRAWQKRRRLLIGLAIAAAVLVIGVIAGIMWRRHTRPKGNSHAKHRRH